MKKNNHYALSFLFVLFSILFIQVSCKKDGDSANQTNNQLIFETGIYEGKLTNFYSNQTLYKFKVEVTKIDNKTYKVKQVDEGGVPEFTMEDKHHGTVAFIYFSIPSQTYQSKSIVGSGGVSGGYDGLADTYQHTFHFDIADPSIQYGGILFDGNKK